VSPGPAPAAASKPAIEIPEYKLETDEFVRKGNGDFTIPHHVTFSRPGSDGVADRAEGNTQRGTVSLFGNVVVHDNGNAPEAGSQDEYAKGGPSTLTCDQLDVDSKSKIYTAIGHVHFTQGARDMVADHGVLNRKTGMLRLVGHVKTKENESTMTAQDLEYNLNSKHVEGNGKPIVIKQPVPTPEPGSATPSPKPKKRRFPF
jgi:lipopolysaccharide assembly outer membrane protein LptD (OstA)